MPPGWSLVDGTISGTSVGAGYSGYTLNSQPNGNQIYTYTITATDKYNYTGTKTYTTTLNIPTITLNSTSTYPVTVSGSGGVGPYLFSISSGTMPPGWSLNGTTGALGGTSPEIGGTYNWTIQAVDSEGFAGYGNYTTTLPNSSRPAANVSLGVPGYLGGGVVTGGYYYAGGTPPSYYTSSGGAIYWYYDANGVLTGAVIGQPTGTSQVTPGVTTILVTPVSTGVVTTQASNTNTACTTTSTTSSGSGGYVMTGSGNPSLGFMSGH